MDTPVVKVPWCHTLGRASRQRRWTLAFMLGVMLWLALAATAQAYVPGAPVWLRLYGTSGHWATCRDLAAGPGGVVVQTGRTWVGTSQNSDILVLKYDMAGHLLWKRAFNGRGNGDGVGERVAIDRSGNIYVAGEVRAYTDQSDLVVLKYAPDGRRLWVRTYDGARHRYESGPRMAVDSRGDVFEAVDSDLTSSLAGIALMKFDSNGHRVWLRRIDPARSPSAGTISLAALALDDAHNVYLCGTSVWAKRTGALTCRFNGGGRRVWYQVFHASGRAGTAAAALAVRGSRVTVVGDVSRGPLISDMLVLGYERASGYRDFAFTYHGRVGKVGSAQAVAVDARLNAYVTGYASVGPVSESGLAFTTLKVDSRGRAQWGRFEHRGAWGAGEFVVLSPAGNVFVTGYVLAAQGNEWATASYDPRGHRRWLRTWHHSGAYEDFPTGIAVGRGSAVYVGGNDGSESAANRTALIRYNR
jgi:hypothetical protein